MKYGDSKKAHLFSHVKNYVEVNRTAVREMHRQVGDLVIDENGIAERGLLGRRITREGFDQAMIWAVDVGLHRF